MDFVDPQRGRAQAAQAAAADVPPQRAGPSSVAINLLAFTVCFVLACVGIRSLLPQPREELLTAKLDRFAKVKDSYDTLFVGSSRAYRHLDCVQFDKIMAKSGIELSSFNFGVPGMTLLESTWVLDQVLELNPKTVKRIFFTGDLALQVHADNQLSDRVVNWHDLTRTRLAVNLVLEGHTGFWWRLPILHSHVMGLAYNLINVGRSRQTLAPLIDGTALSRLKADRRMQDQVSGDGFCSLDEYMRFIKGDFLKTVEKRADDLERDWTKFVAERERISVEGLARREPKAAELAVVQYVVDKCAERDIQVVFMIHPSFDNRVAYLRGAMDAGQAPLVFDFGSPVQFPDFFTRELRFDWNHLNEAGARRITSRIAGRYAAYLRARLSEADDS